MIKAIFLDVDGTLISFKTHRVPASALEALREAHARGVQLFIATGRAAVVSCLWRFFFLYIRIGSLGSGSSVFSLLRQQVALQGGVEFLQLVVVADYPASPPGWVIRCEPLCPPERSCPP